MDEATPHLHIDYIPVGHYKRGIDTQNGIAQALKEMGYGYSKDAIAKWRKSEYDVLREICVRNGIEISEPKRGRGHSYAPDEYKAYKKEIENLKAVIDMYRQIVMQAENTEFSYTKMPFGQNIVSDKSLDELSEKIKAAAVAEKDISVREKNLSEREKIVNEKEKNIDFLTENAEKTNREALANQRAAQRLEEKYYALYNEQENLNNLYRNAVFQRDSFECQLRNKTSECSNLKRDNENYKKKFSEIENYKTEIFELQNKLSENEKKHESNISELNLKIKELQDENNITEKCYCDLYDIADYACKKLKMDVDKALKMRGENYRVSYIFGDERYR